MEVNIEEIGPCRNRIRITLPEKKVADMFAKHYRDLKTSVRFKGFRPGKVPESFLRRKFGDEIADQVKVNLIEESLEKALKENNLTPLGDPDLDLGKILIEPDQDFTFEAIIEVKPSFELGDYSEIEVERPAVEVADEDVDQHLLQLRQRAATFEPVEGQDVNEDDYLDGTVSVLSGDRKLSTDEPITVGPKSAFAAGIPVKDLRSRALEAGIGGTTTFDATIPSYYSDPELRGKEARIILQIHGAKKVVLPEANDEFAEKLDYDDIAELKEVLKRSLQSEKEVAADRAVEDRVIDRILENTPFSVPEGLVERGAERLAGRARLELELAGKNKEEIEEALASTLDQKKAEVEHNLKVSLILDAVAQKEKIFVTEEELDRHLEMVASREGKELEEVRKNYEERNLLSDVRYGLREAKTRALLREKARISEPATD